MCLRSVKLTLENGTCKYSLVQIANFSFILCLQMNLSTVRTGCKIGAMAMSALDRFECSDIKALVDLPYNTTVRVNTHPIQKCAEGLLKVRQNTFHSFCRYLWDHSQNCGSFQRRLDLELQAGILCLLFLVLPNTSDCQLLEVRGWQTSFTRQTSIFRL